MTNEEVKESIERHVRDAKDALDRAVKLADEYGFGFNWEGPGYGMGGWYRPEPVKEKLTREQVIEKLASSEYLTADQIDALRNILVKSKSSTNPDDLYTYSWDESSSGYEEYGWKASSQSC
jgi:hypothetical protein